MSNSTPRAALPPQPSAQGPAELWIQLHGDTQETGLPVDYTGDAVTWCWHQINDSDVRYVRADLAAEQVEQIRRETVQACAAIAAETVVAEFEGVYHYGENAEAAILALLPAKEPEE